MTYTTNEVIELINNYPMYIKQLVILKEDYYKNILGGSIAMYGIEAAMPKGQGGTSDPVFNELNRILKTDKQISRLENKVRYIQHRWDRITDERHAIIFADRLSGRTYVEIAKKLECTPQRIQQIMTEIAALLLD